MATNDDYQEAGFNPKRRLCPDGACIGVMGADGKCTVCGTSAGGEQDVAAAVEDSVEVPATGDELPSDNDLESTPADQDERGEGGFDTKRRLCADETCIGVIGSDNRCSECGKPADA
jgi:hypothetical protein